MERTPTFFEEQLYQPSFETKPGDSSCTQIHEQSSTARGTKRRHPLADYYEKYLEIEDRKISVMEKKERKLGAMGTKELKSKNNLSETLEDANSAFLKSLLYHMRNLDEDHALACRQALHATMMHYVGVGKTPDVQQVTKHNFDRPTNFVTQSVISRSSIDSELNQGRCASSLQTSLNHHNPYAEHGGDRFDAHGQHHNTHLETIDLVSNHLYTRFGADLDSDRQGSLNVNQTSYENGALSVKKLKFFVLSQISKIHPNKFSRSLGVELGVQRQNNFTTSETIDLTQPNTTSFSRTIIDMDQQNSTNSTHDLTQSDICQTERVSDELRSDGRNQTSYTVLQTRREGVWTSNTGFYSDAVIDSSHQKSISSLQGSLQHAALEQNLGSRGSQSQLQDGYYSTADTNWCGSDGAAYIYVDLTSNHERHTILQQNMSQYADQRRQQSDESLNTQNWNMCSPSQAIDLRRPDSSSHFEKSTTTNGRNENQGEFKNNLKITYLLEEKSTRVF
ncbi:hypothetical protein QAD02_000426 [Eretmocerus hayati]|uniref:Uncharacterized protein n=1 Tax=Eretmocerus hayati TaxID=131215 RepID=A0ACC2NDD2_9HYME|nr:hypothetical protein QAD02_000426 [Eretmocerus hayati]